MITQLHVSWLKILSIIGMLAVQILDEASYPKQTRNEVAMDPIPPSRLRAKLQESSAVDPGMWRARRVCFKEAKTMQETMIRVPHKTHRVMMSLLTDFFPWMGVLNMYSPIKTTVDSIPTKPIDSIVWMVRNQWETWKSSHTNPSHS